MKCYKGGQRHNFQPRYDEKPNTMLKEFKSCDSSGEMRKLVYYKVYVHDVCVWCGNVVGLRKGDEHNDRRHKNQ